MTVRDLFIRNIDAFNLIEIFMVSSISSILFIRFYLHLTGYPQIGGHGLHIAHMLFGGFFMMVALIMLFSFLSRRTYRTAALLGGIGFGTFLDELGKFLTSDNNYFFQPTVALIYIVFILLYLASHAIEGSRKYSKTEYLANAFDVLKDAVIQDLNRDEKKLAMLYLRKSDQNNPLVADLHRLLDEIETLPKTKPTWFDKIENFVKGTYKKVIEYPLFNKIVILFFVSESFLSLAQSMALINSYLVAIVSIVLSCLLIVGLYRSRTVAISKFEVLVASIIGASGLYFLSNYLPHLGDRNLSIIEIGELISTSISVILVTIGIYKLKSDRLEAFQFFRYSVLLSIFITQFFVFYKVQFAALIGLSINILTLAVLEYMISREEYTLKQQA